MQKISHGKKLNTNFNRIETNTNHIYLNEFAPSAVGDYKYNGYVKLKLFHREDGSIILPDQVYLSYRTKLLWIQPLYIAPHILFKMDKIIRFEQTIDIPCANKIKIRLINSDFIKRLNDNSFLYKCEIIGPKYLQKYTTGEAKLIDNTPYITLYHHTSKDSKDKILKSKNFFTSTWNIQGNKKIENISFLYLTPINLIKFKEDLEKIAMSSNGELAFILDQNKLGKIPDLILKVYRESTENRKDSLNYWVNTEYIASQPIYLHSAVFDYYEVVSPYIHRIGSELGHNVAIKDDTLIPDKLKNFKYVILGDCTKKEGLQAPYDEENTDQILEIAMIPHDIEILGFWFKNKNTELFGNISDTDKIKIKNE